jgi:hypothetical protein
MTRRAVLAVCLAAYGCGGGSDRPSASAPPTPSRSVQDSPTRPTSAPTSKEATATLAFKIRFAGEAPKPAPLVVSESFRRRAPGDAALCDRYAAEGEFYDESLLVDPATKGVRNVAIMIRNVEGGARPPLKPALLDNVGARFRPRVALAPVGLPVTLKNSDPIPHAAALSTLEGQLLCNVAVGAGSETKSPALLAAGVYVATCPLHDWMRATVVASHHPYVALTDATGDATIDLVPPGARTAAFWHETLGSATKRVEVRAGEVATVELSSADFR